MKIELKAIAIPDKEGEESYPVTLHGRLDGGQLLIDLVIDESEKVENGS